MVFKGYKDAHTKMELPGLLNVEGRQQLKKGNWDEEGGVFMDVIKATEALTAAGFFAPYAMVAPPRLYSLIHRLRSKFWQHGN